MQFNIVGGKVTIGCWMLLLLCWINFRSSI